MCLRARALAAARPGDGRSSWGGRAAVLTGAARRGAASVGSLLIAAVPSSPIESGGFPTSSCCGMRRGRRRAGGVLHVGIFAVLLSFWVLCGGRLWGGCLRRVDWPKPGANTAVVCLLRRSASEQFPFSVRSFISRIGALSERRAHRLDIRGRYKSLRAASVHSPRAPQSPTFSGLSGEPLGRRLQLE